MTKHNPNFGRPMEDRPPVSDLGQAVSRLLVIKVMHERNPQVYDECLKLVADIWWLSANRIDDKVNQALREIGGM